ncbi:MAG: GtrA family protein [Chitinophagaceae bacterium]
MVTFLKAQAASLTASVVDYITTIICVELFKVWYLYGNIIGTIVGGITHFTISKNWVFQKKNHSLLSQIIKYISVWIGNLILNNVGVFVITHYIGISYFFSKIIVSLLVGFTYNYFLQKKFVFK